MNPRIGQCGPLKTEVGVADLDKNGGAKPRRPIYRLSRLA
jgi:hypothetical protein